jgi:hypothetical protein
MSDYISRQSALKAIADLMDKEPGNNLAGHYYLQGAASAKFDINRLPAADVAPVTPAKWIEYPDLPYAPLVQCSNPKCGTFPKHREKTNYCPNCGARMSEVTP